MASSTLFSVRNRRIRTARVWLIRWAWSCAWRSVWGFQSLSKLFWTLINSYYFILFYERTKTYITTVSAICKLRPKPPALIDRMKTRYSESLALKSCMNEACSSVLVPPQAEVLPVHHLELALYILFQATQAEWTKHLMEMSNDEQHLFVQLNLVAHAQVGKGSVKPFVERFDRVKDFGQHKVQQSPVERGTMTR